MIKKFFKNDDQNILIDAFINAGLEYNDAIGKELKILKEDYITIQKERNLQIEKRNKKRRKKEQFYKESFEKADESMNNFSDCYAPIIKKDIESAVYNSKDAVKTVMSCICDKLPKDICVLLRTVKSENDKMELNVDYGVIVNNMIMSGNIYSTKYIINLEK